VTANRTAADVPEQPGLRVLQGIPTLQELFIVADKLKVGGEASAKLKRNAQMTINRSRRSEMTAFYLKLSLIAGTFIMKIVQE
jgi:hypothetical protein